MGLFDLFFTNRAARRNPMGVDLKALREPKSRWYRLVQALSIILIALGAALLLMSFFLPALHNAFDVWLRVSLIMIALGVGGLFALPWVNFLERNKRLVEEGTYADKVNGKFKYVAFGFLCAIGVCVLLWIIAVLTVKMDTFTGLLEVYAGDKSADELENLGKLAFISVAIILTIQVGISSYITYSSFRFRKKFIAVRVIQYVSLAYIDLWLSWFAGALFGGTLIREVNDQVVFAPPIDFKGVMIIFIILALIALLVTYIILNRMVYRERMDLFTRGVGAAYTATDDDIIQGTFDATEKADASAVGMDAFKKAAPAPAAQSAPSASDKTVADKLADLKGLLDKGLITEEEYQAKRQDILNNM